MIIQRQMKMWEEARVWGTVIFPKLPAICRSLTLQVLSHSAAVRHVYHSVQQTTAKSRLSSLADLPVRQVLVAVMLHIENALCTLTWMSLKANITPCALDGWHQTAGRLSMPPHLLLLLLLTRCDLTSPLFPQDGTRVHGVPLFRLAGNTLIMYTVALQITLTLALYHQKMSRLLE